MLVLSRRVNDGIVIGDSIVVRVLGVEAGGQVKLGIDAPRSLRILREELIAEVRDHNRKALAAAEALASLADIQRLMGNAPTGDSPAPSDDAANSGGPSA